MAGVEPMTQIVHRGKLASRSTGGDAISDTLCTSGLMDDVIFAHNCQELFCSVLFFSRPRSEGWPHHMDVLSPFVSVLCHSD